MLRGEKIKYFREAKNLPQRVLAEGICSISYLSKLENNNIQPTEEILKLICERLQIDFQELIQSSSINNLEEKLFEWYDVIKLRDKVASCQYFSKMEKHIKGINDIDILAQFELMVARHYMLINDYKKAKKYLNNVSISIKYLPSKIKTYFNYFSGLYEYLNGNLYYALNYFTAVKDELNEPEYFYQFALIYTTLNKIPLSIIYTERALKEFNKNILFFRSIDCYILLGINYNRIQEYELADSYLNKALKGICFLKESDHLKVKIYHNLGCIYQNQGKLNKAVEYFLKSINASDNLSGREHTIYMLANVLFVLDRKDETLHWIDKGLELLNDKKNKTLYLLNILRFQADNTDNTETFRLFLEEEATPYFKNKNDVINLSLCYELLGKFYFQQKLYKKSSQYYYYFTKINR